MHLMDVAVIKRGIWGIIIDIYDSGRVNGWVVQFGCDREVCWPPLTIFSIPAGNETEGSACEEQSSDRLFQASAWGFFRHREPVTGTGFRSVRRNTCP